MHRVVVRVWDLMKHLDNRFDNVREDRWVTVNKQASDFMVLFSEMFPAQSHAEMLIAVRSWERERSLEFLRTHAAAYPGKMGSGKTKQDQEASIYSAKNYKGVLN